MFCISLINCKVCILTDITMWVPIVAGIVSSQTACSNIPSDNVYYLTSFCGPHTTACGKSCGNCEWAYAADKQRFGCGSVINCVRGGKAANLQVIDYGPDCTLQKKSGKPIIDASYSMCRLFTGGTSCGWSDHFAVTCKKTASAEYLIHLPIGECTWDIKRRSHKLPYCHLPETIGQYDFDNIQEWVLQSQTK